MSEESIHPNRDETAPSEEPKKKRRTMPAQKPATSEQVVVTPDDLIQAVSLRFGPIAADLAALETNAKAPTYLGPDHAREDFRDALKVPWADVFPRGNLWLNPEFSDLAKYVEKCAEESKKREGFILQLGPASVGANYFQDFNMKHGFVLLLSPRVQFVGHTHPYPKDLALTVFGYGLTGIAPWRWK